jgi:Zn-dependent peptidase ImmA (M78 family)/transcriptional regulator with XRE-family HTH domain
MSIENVISITPIIRGNSTARRFVPGRLRDARLAKRLNQTELGEAIGKTRQAVSAYEMGEKTPEASTLATIATVLDQPLAYFSNPEMPGFGAFGPRFFRALGPDTKRRNLMSDVYASWEVQITRYLDDFVNYPPVSLPSITPTATGGAYDDEEIEAAAEECRKTWGLGYGPISNVLALAEGKGIIASRLQLSGQNIEAFSFWNGSRPFIFLASEKDSAARARFDVAHEVGHLVLHRGIGQEDIEDPKTLKRIEREANRFAGALLLPRRSFPNEVFTSRLDSFVLLKERWKVAIQAMIYRCKDLEIFDEYQITNLFKQISARKWRTKEPLDDLDRFPIEQPRLLRKAMGIVIAAQSKQPEDILTDLAMAPHVIENLCNLDTGMFSASDPTPIQPTLKQY